VWSGACRCWSSTTTREITLSNKPPHTEHPLRDRISMHPSCMRGGGEDAVKDPAQEHHRQALVLLQVYEYMPKGSLSAMSCTRNANCSSVGRQVLAIMHRDVKSNILLDADVGTCSAQMLSDTRVGGRRRTVHKHATMVPKHPTHTCWISIGLHYVNNPWRDH
jgi:hypothetical protein